MSNLTDREKVLQIINERHCRGWECSECPLYPCGAVGVSERDCDLRKKPQALAAASVWLKVHPEESTPTKLQLRSKLTPGGYCWASDTSIEDARQSRRKRIFLANVGGHKPIITANATTTREEYLAGDYEGVLWQFAIPVEEVVLTEAEIREKFGIDPNTTILVEKS